ncbi:VirK/YbjX family protein [Chryseobacterium herbae]|uniref:VirK/YbjX family protein n=1 Tax=Chryseobacterium herbae TaxID=2976476 RepID=A0ABT2IV98_9FLAO|nr:VirK/YbjX family protein [Chryseobacterium sp. pc1-10]MCT2562770.1 VirK/YbjX family protein [Chryseobacterium sp. pc1-10]
MFKISRKAWRFAETAFSNERRKYRRKQQYKSFVLTLINYKSSKYWFEILERERYKEVLSQRPRLFLKPFKVYLSTRYSIEQRIKIICDTYDFIYGEHIEKIIFGEDHVVCKFALKNGLPAKLVIGYNDRYRKEGELVLSLVIDHLDGNVASLSFSVEKNEKNEWLCRIGCLQGRPVVNGVYVTKEAQKLMNGIRPKAFLIEILQEFCKTLDIKSINAIGGKCQAQNKKHFIHISLLHTIQFSYNEFWEEMGGQDLGNHWYALPSETSRKNINEVKSEKRASYRKRYELIDSVKSSLCDYLKSNP